MDSVRSVLSLVFEEDEFQPVEPQAAEAVVFHILCSVESLEDLFNFVVITKGFYQVFKRNELLIMRQVMRNMCLPAWEFRETVLPRDDDDEDLYSASSALGYTPSSYFQGYQADMKVIASLKALMVEHCSSIVRPEILAELKNQKSSRIDAALFRIWTFCQIFGCNKGREDDIVAQMDWLRGGALAHQETCTSTISTHDSFYISGVLLNPPEHFAKGNSGGLSAEELYDILEMWNCLSKVTGGLIGQTQQARQFGVYDETEILGGDIDGEEAMLGMQWCASRLKSSTNCILDEWHNYVQTLGLSPIADLATALQTVPLR